MGQNGGRMKCPICKEEMVANLQKNKYGIIELESYNCVHDHYNSCFIFNQITKKVIGKEYSIWNWDDAVRKQRMLFYIQQRLFCKIHIFVARFLFKKNLLHK
jgi:hypothetical protein